MAAAEMYVTVAGAGNNDGLTWGNAMPLADFITEIEGAAEAGDKYFVEEGTYTMGEAIDMSSQDGTAPLPIWIIGVKENTSNEPPLVSDHATGDNRPLFAMEANAFTMAQYWKKYNIRFTGSSGNGILGDDYCVFFNVKSSHSGAYGFNFGGHHQLAIACESTGSSTAAIRLGQDCKAIACYVHDCTNGILTETLGTGIYGCVVDTCSGNGINLQDDFGAAIINNTIYNCGKGIVGTTAANIAIVNNILDANTVGIEWTTQTWCNFIDFNCWNNTDDIQDTDVEIGFYPVEADPGMAGPAGGDFSVQSGDPVNDAGLDAGDFTGATV